MSVAVASAEGLRRFRPYPEYRDSGVEWLSDIPTHWKVKKIKRLCLVRRGASPRPIDDPSYFDDDGEYAWVRISDVTASERYLERTTQRLSELGKSKSVPLLPGELFLSIAATVGKPIIAKIKCCIHDGFVYFVGLQQNREYLYYLFSCGEAYKGLGKLGTQLNLNTDTIGDIHLPCPDGVEQQQIVEFLEERLGQLDALGAKNERLIELLQEQRAALITHAVTKGLDPTAPTKPSGIPWLGDIPAHWDATFLDKVIDPLRRITYGIVQPGPPDPAGRFMVRGQNYSRGWSDPEVVFRVSPEIEIPYKRARLASGDIVMTIVGAGTGNVAIVPDWLDGANITQTTARIVVSTAKGHNRFFAYQLESRVGKTNVEFTVKGAAQPGINLAHLAKYQLVLPPISEQLEIGDYLDQRVGQVDELISRIDDAIGRLKELCTALIFAAVTGKIDVRKEVA